MKEIILAFVMVRLLYSENTKLDAIKGILSNVDINEKEIITIIYGKDVNNDELTHIQDFIKKIIHHLKWILYVENKKYIVIFYQLNNKIMIKWRKLHFF